MKLHYISISCPGLCCIRAFGSKPFDPSGPNGWRITISFGEPSSFIDIVRMRLIRCSGRWDGCLGGEFSAELIMEITIIEHWK